MFIKFEKENYSVFINKDRIVSIVSELHGVCCILKFNLSDNNTQYPSYGFDFETKEQAEKVIDIIFGKEYQDNTLVIINKEMGLK